MKRYQIKRRPLTDTVLASLEPEERDYRELDGNGLYFRGKKNGATRNVIAGKVRRWVSQIFSEAIARGQCELNPASELRHIAESGPRTQNYPHLLEHELPDFLKELRNGTARMRFLTTAALRMILMTASRPGMVRHAEWTEIDLSQGLWTIDKQKMKMRRDFVCPLPRQIVETLREVCVRMRTVISCAAVCFMACSRYEKNRHLADH